MSDREERLEQRFRLSLSLSSRTFEVEGSESFVREQAQRLEALLLSLEPGEAEGAAASEPAAESYAAPTRPSDGLGEFGAFIQRLSPGATDVDRMLAAGFYVQQESSDDAFATADANRRLLEQGIKLGNPSQCVRQSLVAKRVFKTSANRYRVSQNGRQHLRHLMGDAIPLA